MIVDRYYYGQLNKQEQAIYNALYKGVMAHQDIIPIPIKGKVEDAVLNKIFCALTRDNPLIYFLNQSAFSCATDAFGHIAVCPQYFFNKDKIKEYNRKIEKEVNELAQRLHLSDGTDYEKEKKIHDWMCQSIAYDDQGADINNPARVVAAHNIIGVFAHHRAQCEGIAKAVKALLNAVDVKCIVVTGEAEENGQTGPHAWNIVNVDGKPYQLDITWDIGAKCKTKKRIPYDYFNITDEMIEKDHTADCKLPECKSKTDNYFTKNNLEFHLKSRLLEYIVQETVKGNEEFYFRVEGKMNSKQLTREIVDTVAKQLAVRGIGLRKIQQIPNEVIGVYWIKISND